MKKQQIAGVITMRIECMNKQSGTVRIENVTGHLYLNPHDLGEIVVWVKDHNRDIIKDVLCSECDE
jgi:hypothetical protein